MAPPWQWKRAGTDRHALANETIEPASRTPKPKRWLNSKPTPFIVHSNRRLASKREFRFDVNTVKCWISLHVNDGLVKNERNEYIVTLKGKFDSIYLASRASANTPAASGAAAEVPECVFVHLPYKSVVAYFCQVETFLETAFFFHYVHARQQFSWNLSHTFKKISSEMTTTRPTFLFQFMAPQQRLVFYGIILACSWCEKRVQY